MENQINQRLFALRAEMKKENIDAYYIPTDDFHGSEYVCDYFKCREFLSGFTGSAGALVITKDFAGLWTDGRYFIQAAEQIKDTEFTLMKMGEPGVKTISEFLTDALSDGETLGFDGRCVNGFFVDTLKKELEKKQIKFSVQLDLVDRIWEDRPEISFSPVWRLPDEASGETTQSKIAKIREKMKSAGATAHLLTSLEDIAWILNLRGNDIHCDPVFLSYLYITETECFLFADDIVKNELSVSVKSANADDTNNISDSDAHKNTNIKYSYNNINDNANNDTNSGNKSSIHILPYQEIYAFTKEINNQCILLNHRVVNYTLLENLSIKENQNTICSQANPSTELKAVKNEVELSNMREAHIKDGVAVTKFIYYLKNYRDAVLDGNWNKPLLTELDLAEILLNYRKEQKGFFEESFDPIMAYGKNGAIVHYSATKETNAEIEADNFLLSDTGGHYHYGTTDITRTISMAKKENLSAEQKKHYTLVLKANLNILGAKFPKGVTGNSIDALAREVLWKEGLDFNHGTGHGVGYILSVHEGPNAFRTFRGRGEADKTSLVPGMITSDEPGLYFEGKYGIRLENLVECVEEENGFYGFRPLTLVPFDKDAIDFQYLNNEEKEILKKYNQDIYNKISMYLSAEEKNWLSDELAIE